MKYNKVLLGLVLSSAITIGGCGVLAESAFPVTDAPIQIHPARTEFTTPAPSSGSLKPALNKAGASVSKSSSTKVLSTKIQYNKIKKKKRVVVKPKPNYEKINAMLEDNNFNQADSLIKYALSLNPKDPKAQAFEAVSLAKQNKLDAAQNQVNKLIKTNPKNSNLHYAQGLIYYKRTNSSNMVYLANSQKLLSDSLSEFKKAVELDKTNVQALNAAGVAALNLGQNKEAREYFKKAITQDPKFSTSIDNLGTTYFIEGKLNDAQKLYSQALALAPGNPTTIYHQAQVAYKKQDYPKALALLNDALAVAPNSYAIYNLQGEIYDLQGNQAAAINSFKKAVSIKPELKQVYMNMADLYQRRGDSEFAIEQLKTALAINAEDNDVKIKLADVCLDSGKYEQAIENYSTLVGLPNYSTRALKGLASAYYEKAQHDASSAFIGSDGALYKAFESVNKATDSDGQDLELHLAKLKLAKLTNQPIVAQSELDKIVKVPTTELGGAIVKGEAYMVLNNQQDAKKSFSQAVNLTQNADDKLYLAEILIYNRQFEIAKTVLNSLLKQNSNNVRAKNDLEQVQKFEQVAQDSFKSALYFLKSGNQASAKEYLLKSVSLDPDNSQAYFILGQIYEKQKCYKEALINYKLSLCYETNPRQKACIDKKIIRLENK